MAGGTYSTPGETTFTATNGGEYSITAFGATGGGDYASGGKGAEVVGNFNLVAGERIEIVVGAAGSSTRGGGYGGGGGSFVIETFNGTSTVHQKLIIAGGGGGAGYYAIKGGPQAAAAAGGAGLATAGGSGAGGQGSTNANYGGGGGGGYAGGAGGGVLNSTGYGAAGGSGRETSAAASGTYNGGVGYAGRQSGSHGGYGGAGGGGYFGGGGGGGGYGGGTGGAGGTNFSGSYGGSGGGSYDGGTNAVLTAGNSVSNSPGNGNGEVMITPLCFLRGTNILTPTGQVLVEDLRIGDAVVTRFGGIRPIKWIGRQTYAGHAVRSDLDKVPVCVRAGAISEGVPARDLYISPGHSMLVDGTLLIGSLMVNGLTVTQDRCPPMIDYYHLELDAHDCVIAEGAWSETYADAQVSRESFHNAAEFDALYPDDGPAPDEFLLCAPRPERGSMLELALRGMTARCADRVPPGRLRGSVDLIEGAWRVKGWAHDLDHPAMPVLLNVELAGVVIGQVLACDEREDLQRAGYGRGRCAFSFTSPRRLTPELLATLQVRRAADGEEVSIHPNCSAAAERVTKVAARPDLRLVA